MIHRVTFDRHTHLAAVAKTYNQLRKLSANVFKIGQLAFQIQFVSEEGKACPVKNDKDLHEYYKILQTSESIVELRVNPSIPTMQTDGEDDEDDEAFLVIGEEPKDQRVQTKEEYFPDDKDQIGKSLEQMVDYKIQEKLFQVQSRLEQKLKRLLDDLALKSGRFQGKISGVSQDTGKGGMTACQVKACPLYTEEYLLEGDDSNSKQPVYTQPRANQGDLQSRYISCNSCFRNLTHRILFTCEECPTLVFCKKCTSKEAHKHKLSQTPFGKVLVGQNQRQRQRKRQRCRQNSRIDVIEDSPEQLDGSFGRIQTQEQRIIRVSYKALFMHRDISWIRILRLVRTHPNMSLSQISDLLKKTKKPSAKGSNQKDV